MDQSCWIQLFVDTWKPLDLQQSANNQMDGSSSLQKVESTLFCRSVITVIPPDSAATANTSTVTETSKVQHMVEPVVDSSRYFVVKIQNTTMKQNTFNITRLDGIACKKHSLNANASKHNNPSLNRMQT